MLTISYFFTFLLVAFSGITNVLAIPASDSEAPNLNKAYPEVKPGPGLPTLQELGLTSEQLYTTVPTGIDASEILPRSTQYDSVCEQYTTAGVDNVIACYNYLQSIGGNTCGVSGDNVQFCFAGDAQVTGSNISGTGSAASRCSDVALALWWIFTYCNVGGRVGGSAAANGNGWLIVGVENIVW